MARHHKQLADPGKPAQEEADLGRATMDLPEEHRKTVRRPAAMREEDGRREVAAHQAFWSGSGPPSPSARWWRQRPGMGYGRGLELAAAAVAPPIAPREDTEVYGTGCPSKDVITIIC